MVEKNEKRAFLRAGTTKTVTSGSFLIQPGWLVGFALSTVFLIACFLLAISPLIRIPDPILKLSLPPGIFLSQAGNWLPATLGTLNALQSAYGTFFALLSLAFLCYGLSAWLLRRSAPGRDQRMTRGLIWLSTLLIGAVLIVTPATLSHDVIVYASYGRVMATYHANPYFVPIAAFPHDLFASHNYWARVVSAYGPVWTLICAFFGWLLSPDMNSYTVAFRLLAFGTDLLNIWLVGRILRTMGRSGRTVTLGMLLYAWNPLLLLESALGGHNDGLMVTFILAGVLLAARAEKRGSLLRARGYLPVAGALALAVLVKFTALPILAAYLLFLACKALRSNGGGTRLSEALARNWRSALPVLCWSCLFALLFLLAFYGPFWSGHKLIDIVNSFKNPPSSRYAENSFMRSAGEWQHLHPLPPNGLLDLLGNRQLWDGLTIACIVLCLLIGARRCWRKPTTRTFVVIALATMSLVLLVTPWFFAWYITWLLGLGILCLPVRLNRVECALLALVFAFSFSALFTYLFNGGLFGPDYYLVSFFTTIPPTCAFLLTLLLWKPIWHEKIGARQR
ncbi:MAG TPA: hypothetical protein VHD63_01605 [Ktedonobacteraceae bacterium]|nr:hypothetical protein [Ktedonobacteraceae bacterium]